MQACERLYQRPYQPNDREKCYFDSYDPPGPEQVIKTQKVIDYQKEQKHNDFLSNINRH